MDQAQAGATFFSSLYEIRNEMRDTVRSLENVRRKMLGARPEDSGNKALEASCTVGSLIQDIRMLSIQISKAVSEQHSLVGESPDSLPKADGVAQGQRAYA